MSAVVFLVCLAGLAALALQLIKYYRLLKSTRNIAGPPALPVVGNLLELGMNPVDQLKSLFTFWQDYGPEPYRIWLANQLFVIISDPKDVEVVLTKQPPLKKAAIYDLLYDWLGEGLLTSNGIKWYKHRKIITPSFHFSILVDFFDTMTVTSNNLINMLKPKAETEEVFDIQYFVHYCTLDIISETAMGVNINSMNNPKSEVVTAYQDICYQVALRVFKPYLHNPFIFKFTSLYRKEKKALAVLKKLTTEIVEQRMKALDSSSEPQREGQPLQNGNAKPKKMAFLDTLLNATIDGKPLTFAEVFEEVSTFMFEGHDTTTSGITFALYALSRHPEVQEKAFLEQQEIFGDDLKRNATYQETVDMRYLDLVIKEALRMFPSVPMIGRQVTEKFNLNGKELHPGTTITLLLIAMGYNEEYYPEPHKFIPERFEATCDKSHPYEYVPFSAGPRNCIGQKFAMLEMKCVISKILRNFEILPPADNLPPFKGYDPRNAKQFDCWIQHEAYPSRAVAKNTNMTKATSHIRRIHPRDEKYRNIGSLPIIL